MTYLYVKLKFTLKSGFNKHQTILHIQTNGLKIQISIKIVFSFQQHTIKKQDLVKVQH